MNNKTSHNQTKLTSALSFFQSTNNPDIVTGIDRLTDTFLQQDKVSSGLNSQELQQKFNVISVPKHGISQNDFLQEVEDLVSAHSVNTGSPYFIGHMTSLLPNFIRPLAKLKIALNQNMVKLETANAATFYEKQALAMLHKEVYQLDQAEYKNCILDPSKSLGVVTSGGTIANITALQCARASSLVADVEELGIHSVLQQSGLSKSVVIVSELGHYSIKKSLSLLGLGKQNMLTVKVDSQQKIDLDELRTTLLHCQKEKVHVMAMIGVAGTTECGSFDPLIEMADLAEEFGHYFHVDAAWGGPLIFSEQYRSLLNGIERADSVTIDGHKQLYLPMGTGIVLFRNIDMAAAIANEANYIIRRNSHDLGRIAIEGSRPANIFYLQAGLKLFGKQGYAEILDANITTAALMAEEINKSNDFRLLTKPQSNIFLYHYIPGQLRNKVDWSEIEHQKINEFNVQLQEEQKSRGNTFVSRTTISHESSEPMVALRVVIANPLSTFQHCLSVLQEQRKIAKEMEEAI